MQLSKTLFASTLSVAVVFMFAASSGQAAQNDTCMNDNFIYASGSQCNLTACAATNWTGAGTANILKTTGDFVKLSCGGGGGGNATCVTPQAACVKGTDNLVTFRFRARSGSGGGSNLWFIQVQDTAGTNVAWWNGSGNSANGRTGGMNPATSVASITGSAIANNELFVKLNPTNGTATYYYNGTNLGTASGYAITANNINTISMNVQNRSDIPSDFFEVDDFRIAQGCVGPTTGTISPSSATICSGQSQTFSVSAASNELSAISLSYLWKLNGSAVPGANTGNTYSANTGGTYTCDVTDPCGTTTSNSATLTVTGGPTCSITGPDPVCPGSTNSYNGPASMDTYAWTIGGSGTISGPANAPSVSVIAGSSGTYTLTLNITLSGCNSSCQKTVTISDTTAPTINSCGAANTNASANTNCQASVPDLTGDVTATDNCTASGSLTKTQTPTASTLVGLGVTTVTITVKDASNNAATCTKTLTVSDGTAPNISSCGSPQSGSADSGCQGTLPDFTAGVTATDNCTASGSLTKTQTPTAGTTVGLGITSVTVTVKDAANNASTCVNTYTLNDTTAPSINSCGSNATASANSNCQASVPNLTGTVSATDNCPGTLTKTQSPTAGTLVGIGVTTVTVTVKDAANNASTCTKTLTVNDTTVPSISSCGSGQSASADANCQAEVPDMTGNVTATDNCTASGSLTKTQSPAAGTFVGLGVTTVTVTVKDAANNAATCTKTFTVNGSADCCTTAAQCDDSDVCTTDSCDANHVCQHAPVANCCNIDGECDDSNACTTDTCDGNHTCQHGAVANCCNIDGECDDNNVCTTDTCDGNHTCQHGAVANCCNTDPECNDNDACTADTCVNHLCQYAPICNARHPIAWRSIRAHAGLGDVPIILNATSAGNASVGSGGPNIETRGTISTGGVGIIRIQVDFDGTATAPNASAIAVTGYTTTYPGNTPTLGSPTGYSVATAFMVDTDTMEMTFSPALPDQSCFLVALGLNTVAETVDQSADHDVVIRGLNGDANLSATITNADVLLTKSKFVSGAIVDAGANIGNAIYDYNLSGTITNADVLYCNSQFTAQAFTRSALCP